jgi:hypothetical protein
VATIPPRLRLFGTCLSVGLFLLATYAFGTRAWASVVTERFGWSTALYSLAALGTLSMALRYGRDAFQSSRRAHPSSQT